jgi:hypothetical protein
VAKAFLIALDVGTTCPTNLKKWNIGTGIKTYLNGGVIGLPPTTLAIVVAPIGKC